MSLKTKDRQFDNFAVIIGTGAASDNKVVKLTIVHYQWSWFWYIYSFGGKDDHHIDEQGCSLAYLIYIHLQCRCLSVQEEDQPRLVSWRNHMETLSAIVDPLWGESIGHQWVSFTIWRHCRDQDWITVNWKFWHIIQSKYTNDFEREGEKQTKTNKQTNKNRQISAILLRLPFHSCSPGPCLKSIKSTSSSGQMLTGCRIASKQWTIDETEKALFPLCSWSGANAVSAVGFYDDNNSPGAVGHYYKCAAGETLRVATCNLVTLLGGSEPGTCYHSYSKPGFVSP